MAISCNTDDLAAQAKCFKCLGPATLLEVQTYLLCQLVNAGGGGGSGSVTSFSSGNLSTLFTTSVATATTTPALSFSLNNQNANLIFAGPTSGGAAAPTFRSIVAADFGATLNVQFAEVGIGAAPSALTPLIVSSSSTNVTKPVFSGTIQGQAGQDVNVIQFDANTGDPYMTIGQVASNNGCLFQYQRSLNQFKVAVHGGAGSVTIDNVGSLVASQSITSSAGNFSAAAGIYICQGNNGISQTFDIGIGNTQITFVGGIATAIA